MPRASGARVSPTAQALTESLYSGNFSFAVKEADAALTRLEDENRELTDQLSIVGTKDYIVSSAMENYSYVKKDDIRFEFSNPEALYTYSEEELRILVDEMAD